MLLQTHYFSVYLEKHQQNKLWMTSGIQGMLVGFGESLSRSQRGRYHFLSVLSSVGAHYKEKTKK